MTINLSLYECLQQISLERYHDNFTDRGIADVGGLLSLTMQDYPTLGISSMADRQNLFYLIQTLKAMEPLPQERRLDSAVKTEGLLRERMSTGKRKGQFLSLSLPDYFPTPGINPHLQCQSTAHCSRCIIINASCLCNHAWAVLLSTRLNSFPSAA